MKPGEIISLIVLVGAIVTFTLTFALSGPSERQQRATAAAHDTLERIEVRAANEREFRAEHGYVPE